MDIAIIIVSLFVAFFIAISMVMDATYIRTLRERISELEEKLKKEEENSTEMYSKGAEIDRDRCEELRLAESHQKWFKCEVQVRAFIMSSPTRVEQLRNAGHLDRQNWIIGEGTKILFSCSEEEFTTELINWWETTTHNNFNI
ncbi:hypothetical protein EBT31_18160 [bacterium]|nr:hypothetical protein [bacterium]